MVTLAILNAKGGIGKTTSAMVIADILSREYGKRVLLIDLDSQINLSKQMEAYTPGQLCVAHLLVDKNQDIREVIQRTAYEGIDIIPSDKGLEQVNTQIQIDSTAIMQLRLKKHIMRIKKEYDFCILDCPNRLKEPAVINGLAFTDDILIPIRADDYSFDAIDDSIAIMSDVEDFNDEVRIAGIFICAWERTKNTKTAEEILAEKYGPYTMQTHIRKASAVSNATFPKDGKRQRLIDVARNSTALEDYRELVKEYLEGREE